MWSSQTGELLASMIGERDGEWLTITPKGFFAASRKGTAMLEVVRGFEPFSVMQFYDHLYRPDLVEQLLKGDPEGKYADAASKLNLEKILEFRVCAADRAAVRAEDRVDRRHRQGHGSVYGHRRRHRGEGQCGASTV